MVLNAYYYAVLQAAYFLMVFHQTLQRFGSGFIVV
jgi:hypothetical protein